MKLPNLDLKICIMVAIILLPIIQYNPSVVVAAPNREEFAEGTVLQLDGTPHLWVYADRAFHWASDSRALQGRFVDWGNRRTVTVFQLKSFTIGDPWLSTGLVKVGDPIYLPKWESGNSLPELFHIQNIKDVEIFGIATNNYGKMVLDQRAWESQTGLTFNSLSRSSLPSAVAMPTVTPTVAPTAIPSPTSTAMSVEYCSALAVAVFSSLDSIIYSQRQTNETALAIGQRQSSSAWLRGATSVQSGVSAADVQKRQDQQYNSIPGKAGDSFSLRMARGAGYIDIEDVIQEFNQRSFNKLRELGCSPMR